jgi:hypothetical protein
MFLVQILLPLFDNSGRPIPKREFRAVKKELTEKFHGLTAYSRSTAEGFWGTGQATQYDEIIVYEVMISALRQVWWRKYRRHLEKRFRQDSIIIRSHQLRLL